MAIINGTKVSDTFSGSGGDDIITADKGNDVVSAGNGNDIVSGDAGNDTLFGEAGNDVLLGGDGNDSLDGGTGDDSLFGGDGNDVYIIDSVNDVATETDDTTDGGGVDTIRASVNYTLGNYIENGVITAGSGITLTGNGLVNVLSDATAGGNTLDGGTGADTMIGSTTGSDTFLVDTANDTVSAGSGNADTIISDISWSLATRSTNVENLTLTAAAGAGATATGNTGANVITANDLGNSLDGGAGNDTLVGGLGNDSLDGGTGNDGMAGGAGNDTYFMDNSSDTVTEGVGAGTDTVNAGFTYTLLTNFENLTLTGTGNYNGTGNAADNIITGNSGDNSLDGVSGTDTLNGMDGNDTLAVHSGLEVVNGGNGTDLINSDVTYNLNSATSVENLTLTGSSNINGTGTTGANVITGNTGDNSLDGGGAGGTDTLIGGTGNDTYVVYNTGDIVSEGVGAGTDTVIANGISYTLSGDLENLTLQSYNYYGTTALTATGNTGANIITDNSASYGGTINNVLLGGGGTDTLVNNAQSAWFIGNLVFGTSTLDGGTGADAMSSTADNRTIFVVDNIGDTVDGNSNYFGFGDEIRSSIGWDLSVNTTDVFKLTLTGSANINGAGTASNDSITGNSGNNTLTGLGGVDVLSGGDGNDTLDGGTGNDSMIGGLGNDTFIVDSTSDAITELAGQGTDTVIASVDYTLSGNIENLTITGTAVTAIGDAGANVITGNGNDNTINGMGGADAMSGGLGNDLYFVDNAGDQVFENAGEGTDTVNASVSYTLSSTSEIEILNLIGGAININGTGNALANTITGNDGNNTLDGGAGVDTLIGGLGNDTYVTDNPGDVLSENAGEGNDTVVAGYSYTIAAEFENVTLSGTGDFNATGNAANNSLIGNSGNNTLDGLAGADSMEGGAGNDYFIVDNSGDVATDLGGGFDEVFASASFTLGTGIENLTLDTLVVGAIDGTGNNLDNVITGTDGGNYLQGLGGNDALYTGTGNDTLDGGTGADSMTGGDGNDSYYVDNAGDAVFENSGQGNDTVYASVSYTLSGSNIESLVLTGSGNINGTGTTTDNDVITGNTGNNTLTGLDGNDTLDGGGGNDRLVGGTGDDYYYVDSSTDVVVENPGEGNDTVETSVTYTLAANVENGIITSSGTLTGNTGDNTLTNDAVFANVTLNGGLGADAMINATGLNTVTFIVDNFGDSVDGSASGTDIVRSSVNFDMNTQGDGDVDHLVLLGTALIGIGNGLDNSITGTTGANTLDGGAGADTLNGGSGNDTYYVDNAGDVLIDSTGVEIVHSTASTFTLATGFEKLFLDGSGNIDGHGNAGVNTITGNDGNNLLTGEAGNDILSGGLGLDILDGGIGNDTLSGGDGNDTLIGGAGTDKLAGGAGADAFIFTSTANGIDTISDFNAGAGDYLDLNAILHSPGGSIEDYLQVTQSGSNTIIKVDVNGATGGFHYVQIATLTGVNLGTDETAIVGSGAIHV